jgi:hypothetical protein
MASFSDTTIAWFARNNNYRISPTALIDEACRWVLAQPADRRWSILGRGRQHLCDVAPDSHILDWPDAHLFSPVLLVFITQKVLLDPNDLAALDCHLGGGPQLVTPAPATQRALTRVEAIERIIDKGLVPASEGYTAKEFRNEVLALCKLDGNKADPPGFNRRTLREIYDKRLAARSSAL